MVGARRGCRPSRRPGRWGCLRDLRRPQVTGPWRRCPRGQQLQYTRLPSVQTTPRTHAHIHRLPIHDTHTHLSISLHMQPFPSPPSPHPLPPKRPKVVFACFFLSPIEEDDEDEEENESPGGRGGWTAVCAVALRQGCYSSPLSTLPGTQSPLPLRPRRPVGLDNSNAQR